MTINECLDAVAGNTSLLQTFSAGESLFSRGNPTVGVYVVVNGCVKLVRSDMEGKEAVLYVARAGNPFAEASIFSSVYHCDAIATMETTVRRYSKAALLSEFDRDLNLAKTYAAMLGHQLMAARARLERLNMHSARDRLRHFLMLESDAGAHSIEVQGTFKDLAAELGLTHEAFYRTLARMVKDGEIKREGNVVWLLGSRSKN